MQNVTPLAIGALAVELIPAIAFAFAGKRIAAMINRWPVFLRIVAPAAMVAPYLMVALPAHIFNWQWCMLYTGLPVAITWLLMHAAAADPEQRGDWRDYFILLVVGLAVDLRWFEAAWPSGLRALNELFLVDAGLYGFLAIRQLTGTGYNFCQGWSEWKADWKTGLRELLFFAPAVLILGIALGFIHPHRNLPGIGSVIVRWIAIFFFTALPEELFFRAWVQNLLERRIGRRAALVIASMIFGLSHFNKRLGPSAHFNWQYVLLAILAGVFYGRAWRENRHVPASTITHTSVDWLWGLWF